MNATLVSHYGPKSECLASYLSGLQELISESLPTAFVPYTIEQVHASIIGFEEFHSGRNDEQNLAYRTAEILAYLRSAKIPSFHVRIGGYSTSRDYGFLSRGRHPGDRSFSIQQEIAVAMGWPDDGSNVIDDFRRSFSRFGVTHKWHRNDSDVDNDFYFVLGKIDRDAGSLQAIAEVEQNVKSHMANTDYLDVEVGAKTLSIVCYDDRELPRNSSVAHAVTDEAFSVEEFLHCIGERAPDVAGQGPVR